MINIARVGTIVLFIVSLLAAPVVNAQLQPGQFGPGTGSPTVFVPIKPAADPKALQAAWKAKDEECVRNTAPPAAAGLAKLTQGSDNAGQLANNEHSTRYVDCMMRAGYLVDLYNQNLRTYVPWPDNGVCVFEGQNFYGRWRCVSATSREAGIVTVDANLSRLASVKVLGNACWIAGNLYKPEILDGGADFAGKISKAALRPQAYSVQAVLAFTGKETRRCDAEAKGLEFTVHTGPAPDDAICIYQRLAYQGNYRCFKQGQSGEIELTGAVGSIKSVWMKPDVKGCWRILTKHGEKMEPTEDGRISVDRLESDQPQHRAVADFSPNAFCGKHDVAKGSRRNPGGGFRPSGG